MKKKILLLLTDLWNDWEASYAIAVLNAYTEYRVESIAVDALPKRSMGGINADIDHSIAEFTAFDAMSLVIVPGGLSWKNNDDDRLVTFLRTCHAHGIMIASICGSSTFLARHSFLNAVIHTGDSLPELLEQPHYLGKDLYIDSQLVIDKGIITANETAAVQFAYEIFKWLQIDTTEAIESWYDRFSKGSAGDR